MLSREEGAVPWWLQPLKESSLHTRPGPLPHWPSLWTHTCSGCIGASHPDLQHPSLLPTHCGFPKILSFPSPPYLGIKHPKAWQLNAGQVSAPTSHLRPQLVPGKGLRVTVMGSSQRQTGPPVEEVIRTALLQVEGECPAGESLVLEMSLCFSFPHLCLSPTERFLY